MRKIQRTCSGLPFSSVEGKTNSISYDREQLASCVCQDMAISSYILALLYMTTATPLVHCIDAGKYIDARMTL